MKQIDQLKIWYDTLQPREQVMVSFTAVIVAITLFFLVIWEPVVNYKSDQLEIQKTRTDNYLWMQEAAAEVKSLKASGTSRKARDTSQPVSLLVERSATVAGLKQFISKIETDANKKVRASLDGVAFNQLLIWLNNLEMNYSIEASSASIDKTEKPGLVDARLTFERP